MSGLLKNILKPPFKHKKLSEDILSLDQTSSEDGVTFSCRDLGSTFVTEAQEEATTADAIRRIVHAARVSNLKPRRVTLKVSSRGVRVHCCSTAEVVLDTDIYDISYCSADAHYNHVFAFITTEEKNAYECHAYLCHNAKTARNMSLSVAQAFTSLAQKHLKNGSDILTDSQLRAKLMEQKENALSCPSMESLDKPKPNSLLTSFDSLSLDSESGSDMTMRSLRSASEDLKAIGEDVPSGTAHGFRNTSSHVQDSLRKNWLILKSGFRGSNPQATLRMSFIMLNESKQSLHQDTDSLLFLPDECEG